MPAPPCVTAVTAAPLAQVYVGGPVPESLEERSRRPDSNRGPLHCEASHGAGMMLLRAKPDRIGPLSEALMPPERPQP